MHIHFLHTEQAATVFIDGTYNVNVIVDTVMHVSVYLLE